jgi:hypothetical protein
MHSTKHTTMPSSIASIASISPTSSEHTLDSFPAQRKSRVSAEHTLNRVRENQRRHRARQRDHFATLEQKLAEKEKQLKDARKEIAALKAEHAMCPIQLEKSTLITDSMTANTSNLFNKQASEIRTPESTDPQCQYLNDTFISPTISSNMNFIVELTNTIPPPPPENQEPFTGPPLCCSDTPSFEEPMDPECSTCKTRPPPDPSESTTLCAQAFVLISQQNFRNLDPETIRMWLVQGLRRAQREGEGCRVENGALWRLLDYISGL